MNYWICTKCGKLFPINDIKEKHELHITGKDINIPINLCNDCFNQLYLHSFTASTHKAKYPILTVAKYLIDISNENKNPINSYNLNRIMFLIWIDYYKKYKQWLFDDFFITDITGPSFKKILNRYCGYGAMPIIPIIDSKDYYIFDEEDKNFLKERTVYYQQFYFFELIKKCQTLNFNWANTNNILDEHTYGLGDVVKQI